MLCMSWNSQLRIPATLCKEWECVLELSEIGTSVLVVVLAQVQAVLKLLSF